MTGPARPNTPDISFPPDIALPRTTHTDSPPLINSYMPQSRWASALYGYRRGSGAMVHGKAGNVSLHPIIPRGPASSSRR